MRWDAWEPFGLRRRVLTCTLRRFNFVLRGTVVEGVWTLKPLTWYLDRVLTGPQVWAEFVCSEVVEYKKFWLYVIFSFRTYVIVFHDWGTPERVEILRYIIILMKTTIPHCIHSFLVLDYIVLLADQAISFLLEIKYHSYLDHQIKSNNCHTDQYPN